MEFALVVPMLLLVLTGIFSFGIIFNQYQLLTNAANAAARAFALSAGTGGSNASQNIAPNNDPCAYVDTIVQADTPGIAASGLVYKIVYTSNTPTTGAVTTINGTGTSNSTPTCSSIVMNSGDTVQVTVTYQVSATLFGWAMKKMTLSASSMELVQ